eukprot:scpid109298/ scgid26203/ 
MNPKIQSYKHTDPDPVAAPLTIAEIILMQPESAVAGCTNTRIGQVCRECRRWLYEHQDWTGLQRVPPLAVRTPGLGRPAECAVAGCTNTRIGQVCRVCRMAVQTPGLGRP